MLNFYPTKKMNELTRDIWDKSAFTQTGVEELMLRFHYSEETMARAMRVSSYPNFVIMDAAMENITQLPGYREPQPFVEALAALMENFKN